MKLFGLVVVTALAVGCSPATDDSEQKSFLGLQASQNSAVRDGQAPTFIALGDWFQRFIVAAAPTSNGPRTASMDDIKKGLPDQYRPSLVDYVREEKRRTSDFLDALRTDDNAKLKALVEKESFELYDIVMVMLNPLYEQRTEDKFARFMALTRSTNFVDVFASDFIGGLLKTRQLPEIQRSLETERKSYEKALRELYLGSGDAKRKLRADLDKNMAALTDMETVLTSEGAALTGYNAPTGTLRGSGAAFMQFQNGLMGDVMTNANNASRSGGPVPSFVGSLPADSAAPPPASTQQTPGTPPPLAGPTSPLPPTTPPVAPPGGGGLGGLQALLAFLPPGLLSGSPLTANPKPVEAIVPAEPTLDCRTIKMTDSEMINCQRYYAYSTVKLDRGRVRGFEGGLNLTLAGTNASIIRNNATRVVDQGSVPSCTAASMTNIAETAASIKQRPKQLDHNTLWNAQGQQTYMQAAQNAARNAWSGQGVTMTEGTPIRSLQDLVACVDAKKMGHIGIDLSRAWTANGGGDEFTLTTTTTNGQILGCTPGGSGHAVAVMGYTNEGGRLIFLIKNSWGQRWGDQGYTKAELDSCLGNMDGACVDFNVQ